MGCQAGPLSEFGVNLGSLVCIGFGRREDEDSADEVQPKSGLPCGLL